MPHTKQQKSCVLYSRLSAAMADPVPWSCS